MTTTIENEGFDYSRLTAAERLLLAQELPDSVYDDLTPRWTGAAAGTYDERAASAA